MSGGHAQPPLRHMGWINAAVYLAMRGLQRFSGGHIRLVKYDLLVQPLDVDSNLCGGRDRGFEVRELTPDEAVEAGLRRDLAIIESRFRSGARCLGVQRDAGVVGSLWYKEGAYDEDEVRCVFVPTPRDQCVWDFDVFILPEARGTTAFARLWEEASRRLARKGYRYTCSRISAFNTGSRSAHHRLGARTVGKAFFLCVGGWQLMACTRHPYLHVSLHSGSRPWVAVGPDPSRVSATPEADA